jgi:murein DD-endopeptidase MepM/ murein hydrolase activator NlpD
MKLARRYNSRMRRSITLLILFILVASFAIQPVSAQAGGPVYIVQPGDTLSYIASRFNVTVNDLLAANPSVDPNLLAQGQQVVIPGLEGISGILDTEIIPFGDTLRSLSRRTQVSDEQLIRLNRLVSPTELYVGISLIIPTQAGRQELNTRIHAGAGESLLELAVKQNSDPWTLAGINKQNGTWDTLPGDVLYSPTDAETTATGLPSVFLGASIEPLPMVQGGTEVIHVQTQGNVPVQGLLTDMPLHFFQSNNEQVALQGVHALLKPGVYPLRLEVTLPDGVRQSFEQMILVTEGDYYSETLSVPPETIDPVATEPENLNILAITSPFTPTQYWSGIFESPAVYKDQYTSRYGVRRTYKGKGTDLTIEGLIHTGLDFAGGEGLQIFAPAAGRVVFAAPLTVRGNATVIDHGLGVYSGFWHQSQILVQVGDAVEQGQVIGLVGGTGRATGAHLHWEIWVNGVQVDPLDWLNQAYP